MAAPTRVEILEGQLRDVRDVLDSTLQERDGYYERWQRAVEAKAELQVRQAAEAEVYRYAVRLLVETLAAAGAPDA